MEDPASVSTYNPEPSLPTDDSDPSGEPSAPEPDNALATAASPSQIAKPTGHRRISLNHHRAHCAICRHPECDVIEQAFLHWQRPSIIVYDFQLPHRRALNRHARALGLYELRSSRSRRSLEFIMEQAETVKATADSVIRAVKAHACLGEDGRWTEPTRHTIITHEYAEPPIRPGSASRASIASEGSPRQTRKATPRRLGARTTLLGAALSLILPDSRQKGGA